jgi:two-component system, NarL family, response regulator DegU
MEKIIRLLIVDDIPHVRRSLRMALSVVGGEALEIIGEAADGSEALEKVNSLQPDVVLLDLEMPRTDGFSAARAIKSNHAGVKIAALSIHSQPEDLQRAFQAGVDSFIEKGSSVAYIFGTIQNLFRNECKEGEKR